MTSKGFIFLMLVTIATVMIAGTLAENFTEPGLQRTLLVAVITVPIVMWAGRWAEKKGWVKGSVRLDKLKDEFKRPGQNATPESSSEKTGDGDKR